jgi:hypothetical protein
MFLWRNLKSTSLLAAAQAVTAKTVEKADAESKRVSAPAQAPEPVVSSQAVQS